MLPSLLITAGSKQISSLQIQLGTYRGAWGERMCCKGKGFQGGEWWVTDLFAQLAPVSGFILVAVEHIDATRDRYDCYGRFISPVAHLQ